MCVCLFVWLRVSLFLSRLGFKVSGSWLLRVAMELRLKYFQVPAV